MYVDSNIFVFAALDSDERGENARKIIELAEDGKIAIFISPLVFDEVLQIIQKLTNKKVSEHIGRSLLSLSSWLDVTYNGSVYAFEYYQTGLVPRDSMHTGIMRDYGITVILSEDSDFDSVPYIKRRTLKEVLNEYLDNESH
ncbi:MAG: type II toxin-antitoxin system VapC family toxin [Theionarchaea archaeon]|nr:type II toxin-antitoxin system VapC family toxin [Theionarchaea archaeon]